MSRAIESDMTGSEPKIRKSVISGRELFVCDDMVEDAMVQTIGTLVRSLHYIRKEKSRPGVPGLAAVSDIPMEKIAVDPFLRGLRQTVERLFPGGAIFGSACLCQLQRLWRWLLSSP